MAADARLCTLTESGETYMTQKYYFCLTCGLKDGFGVWCVGSRVCGYRCLYELPVILLPPTHPDRPFMCLLTAPDSLFFSVACASAWSARRCVTLATSWAKHERRGSTATAASAGPRHAPLCRRKGGRPTRKRTHPRPRYAT